MSTEERQEVSELITRLVALEKPATKAEAKRLRREWKAAGYEAVVEAWSYHHRRLRKEQAA